MTYPQKPESLKYPSLGDHPASENPGNQTIQHIVPWDTWQQLQGVAEQCLDRWGDEEIPVCRIPYVWGGGHIWCRINRVWRPPSLRGAKGVDLETISGAEIFNSYTHGGWCAYDSATFPAVAVDHVALVWGGEIAEYYGRPFSSTFLEGAMPEWASDEGCAEYRLRQQELEREVEDE